MECLAVKHSYLALLISTEQATAACDAFRSAYETVWLPLQVPSATEWKDALRAVVSSTAHFWFLTLRPLAIFVSMGTQWILRLIWKCGCTAGRHFYQWQLSFTRQQIMMEVIVFAIALFSLYGFLKRQIDIDFKNLLVWVRELGVCADNDILAEISKQNVRDQRRRRSSMGKRARVSLCMKTNERARFSDVFSAEPPAECLAENHEALFHTFAFLEQSVLMTTALLVCWSWYDAATAAMVKLMSSCLDVPSSQLVKSGDYLAKLFPTGHFLADGASKKVYQVQNSKTDKAEAVSVM